MSHQPPPRPALFAFIMRKPQFWIAWLVSIIVFAAAAAVNLLVLGDRMAGLAYFLPLLVCLWTRDRRILYLMATAATALTWAKTFGTAGHLTPENWDRISLWVFQCINIWVPVAVIHVCMYAFDRLDLKRKLLLEANDELEGTNQELARREQEVVHQNDELRNQAGELERQAEELRQQAEELEQQTVELHAANDELTRRERGLQTLLESARWLRSDLLEGDVMSAVCQAAVQVMEEGVTAAAVVHNVNGKLALRGHYGFGVHGTLRQEVPFTKTFAMLVMDRGQTAYIADIESRPDIAIPQPAAGRLFHSILCTPLTIEGRVVGAVEVYAQQPREWTDGEFKVIEWLAAQCALALQAIEFQQEVLVKRREAEEASVQKTRFLAAVSHDVRTPANAISLMADLIEQAAANPQNAGPLEVSSLARDLKTNARSLVELVSDVLDLTRLDTGKRDLQMSDFQLQPFIENALRQFEHVAHEKKLRLTIQACSQDLMLRTDKVKLARILSNLLGNAVKFTEVGAVEVRCQYPAGEDGSTGALAISVADTGVGIPKDALPRIFDEFYQLQNPERDRNKGSGLGLAICKRLVDALGCSLSVESSVGVGTTFTILLPPDLISPKRPASPTDSPVEAATHVASGPAMLQDVKVLLVEDHEVTRRAASRLLASRGAAVLEARNGREALHLLIHETPHVLLLDLMLPDGDGTIILRHLHEHRPPELKCVLAVSGDVRDARIAEVKSLGADDLLAKPLDIHKLLDAIVGRLTVNAQ